MRVQRQVVQRLLFQIGENVEKEAGRLERAEAGVGVANEVIAPAAGGEPAIDLFVAERRQADLLEVIDALCLPGRFPRRFA